MDQPESQPVVNARAAQLIALAALSTLGYAVLMWFSGKFDGGPPREASPILTMLAWLGFEYEMSPTLTMLVLFGFEFICYFFALRLAIKLPPSKWLVGGILAAACLFRGVLLPSIPIHEIDIYRYIWDGAVLADGVSPYQYPPKQVLNGVDDPLSVTDQTLQQLVELQATSQSLGDSLREIHYGQFPSPYPMVSQAVFALSAVITPDTASTHTRLVIMKSLLVLFDLATLIVVMLLVREVGMHPGWSLAYGWCPLLLKEIANGGHLDSIAIFFTTLAVWLLVKSVQSTALQKANIAVTGMTLGLAIGAKLYPVVLLPLFTAVLFRRLGWVAAGLGSVTTVLVSAGLLYPLLGVDAATVATNESSQQAVVQPDVAGQLNTPPKSPPTKVDPDEGIKAFLNQWEMNDLIFMVVLENLRQQEGIVSGEKPWFVVTSDDWSRSIITRWARFKQRFSDDSTEANEPLTPAELKEFSFSLARLLTGGAFALVACLLAWFAAGKNDPQAWCRAAMLTLAWFWLTCPTQNPWYWCWVLPFLPFARYRTWYAVAALTMLYYLRFYFSAEFPEKFVLGTTYKGVYFFYFVIAWIEFLPVLVALSVEWFLKTRDPAKSVIPEA